MKKRIGIIALLTAIFCLSASTAAYLLYARYMENRFTVGSNVIEITEDYRPPKELEVGENVFKKKVRVENTGTIPCFVRVFAEFSDPDIRGLSRLSADGKTWYATQEYRYHLPDGWEYIDGEDELLGPYYYYTDILYPGEKTPALFDSVNIVVEEAWQIKDCDIIIYAESVQSADKDGNQFGGTDAWEEAWREFLSRR